MAQETPEALSDDAREALTAILAVCARLLKAGETRLVFTSREKLPAPFDAARHRRELHRLDREDAVKLVERVVNVDAAGRGAGAASDAAREEIEQLVDAVHGHARTLALLAPALRERGVEATRNSLIELMAEMDRKFPDSREQSVFASVELSLRRLSPANRDRTRVLGVFHGGVHLEVLCDMMPWERADVGSLAGELIQTGLATSTRYNHLRLAPALCPYLLAQMDGANREELTARWDHAMRLYVAFLEQEQDRKTEMSATLTLLELPNLLALLDHVQRNGICEATIHLANSLYSLLRNLGKRRVLERVTQVRDAAAAARAETWNHALFVAQQSRIEQERVSGESRQALDSAKQLLQRARTAGGAAYPDADYDLALACCTMARVLHFAGRSEQALPLLDEARTRFEFIVNRNASKTAAGMVSVCFAERGNCLLGLGRLDEAVADYEESIRRADDRGDVRGIAVGQVQLGKVRLRQQHYKQALEAFEKARKRFTQLKEPAAVATIWHNAGLAYAQVQQPEAAEDAYRKALAIDVQLGNIRQQADTLAELGNLYVSGLGRAEEAVVFYKGAAKRYTEIKDVAGEGQLRRFFAATLRVLGRLDDARHEIEGAIECNKQFGHAVEPWMSWAILADIETDAGNPTAVAEATRQAIACYLAYRRDGGENHFADGRIALAVTQSLLAGKAPEAAALLQQLAARPDAGWLLPFLPALQAVVAGSRDRTLADAPVLNYTMAAEILLVIETLETAGK